MTEISPAPIVVHRDDLTIRDIMKTIDSMGSQVLVVIDSEEHVLGIITDGDARRGLLAGKTLDDPYFEVLNSRPITTQLGKDQTSNIAAIHRIRHVLRVDENNKFLSFHIEETPKWKPPPALILAGGRGTRLHPLTIDTPKPLLEVGGMPILERIIRDLILTGISEFHFSLGYLPDKVITFLENLELDNFNWSHSIESQQLGTAGPAIEYLADGFRGENLLVVNGDLMATPNYAEMISLHEKHHSALSVMSVQAKTKVQFGVLEIDGELLKSIKEKPEIVQPVAAGVYLLRRDSVLGKIEPGPLDMPDLINMLSRTGHLISVYKYSGQWFDIGRPEDLKSARKIFSN